jgi:hypothetical protein
VTGGPGQPEHDLEPLGGEVALLAQPPLERGRQPRVGLEEEAGGGDARIVERRGGGAHEPMLAETVARATILRYVTCVRKSCSLNY